jgi:hypothetical protein
MCGCNKGANTAKRYEVVDASKNVLSTHASHPEALSEKRANPGSSIRIKPATDAK